MNSDLIRDKAHWDSLSVTDKVGICQSCGISGQNASKSWDALEDVELQALVQGIVPDYTSYKAGLSFADIIYDQAHIKALVEKNKPLVSEILTKYLSGTQSGNGSTVVNGTGVETV